MVQHPFNTEKWEVCVIRSMADPLKKGRVQLSPASLAGAQGEENFPWGTQLVAHSQMHNMTAKSAHSYKCGDTVLVQRPTASGQDWIIAGHHGTVPDGSGGGSGTG